jgi:hypothetical protein
MFTHKMTRDRKPLLEAIETRQSDLANWRLRFCRDQRQSGAPSGFNEVLLLWPSSVWMAERCGPLQLWRLKWWLRDLIDEKKRKLEN